VVSPRNAALAGVVGPVVFALVAVVLTFAQYDFMRGLGWEPLGASDVPWPSGLALGPLGWLQVLSFAFFGLTLILFALGLDRAVPGLGARHEVGIRFECREDQGDAGHHEQRPPGPRKPPPWRHGAIHLLAFLLLVLSFLLALFFWWRRLSRDPRWHAYAPYTLITAILYILLLFASVWQWGFYLFLANVLIWIELMALHLRSVENTSSPRVR
jgi:hypothetical protein